MCNASKDTKNVDIKKPPPSALGASATTLIFKTIVKTKLRAAATFAYDGGDSNEQLQAAIAARGAIKFICFDWYTFACNDVF